MKLLRAITISAAIVLCSGITFATAADTTPDATKKAEGSLASAYAAAKDDPLLTALLIELERSKLKLKMDQVAAPYYVEYRVDDVDQYVAEAAFGALRENERGRFRLLHVVVRIGDYKQDSYYGRGQGESAILPLDDDPLALRQQIWLATDSAYKAAGEALSEKLAALKQFTPDATPPNDFAEAPVVADLKPTLALQVDSSSWKKTLEDATALYRDYPDVESLTASVQFTVTNQYFVNSEGTVTRNGRQICTLALNASAQAPDGMRLSRNPAWIVGSSGELPGHDALLHEAKKTLDTVESLRQAPIVEESYRGPVLFSPDAADDVFASLIGTNIVGRKPQLGRPNRTTGAYATSYKTRVLPNFLSVVDDPTLNSFGGKSVIGNYGVDSDGVKAQQVTLIDKGMLVSYLVGRQPIRDFPASNGHGRASAGGLPGPNLGVLLLKSSQTDSPEALKQRMIQAVKDQELPYGYRVETLGPGNSPRLLYRIYPDGHEQLVRGAVFNELDVRAIRNDLVGVGNDPLVSNRQGGVPTTIISPSLLFDELEVKRADTSKEKLPDYPAPPFGKN